MRSRAVALYYKEEFVILRWRKPAPTTTSKYHQKSCTLSLASWRTYTEQVPGYLPALDASLCRCCAAAGFEDGDEEAKPSTTVLLRTKAACQDSSRRWCGCTYVFRPVPDFHNGYNNSLLLHARTSPSVPLFPVYLDLKFIQKNISLNHDLCLDFPNSFYFLTDPRIFRCVFNLIGARGTKLLRCPLL